MVPAIYGTEMLTNGKPDTRQVEALWSISTTFMYT